MDYRWMRDLSWQIRQDLRQLIQPKRLAILEAALIGLVAALSAVLLKQGVFWLSQWRIRWAFQLHSWIVLPLWGFVGCFLAGLLVEHFAPEAMGSGIPQVKAALALRGLLNWRIAVVKLLSTTLTVGTGLTLGRQGPTVQVGAALAGQLSRWLPTSPEHQRHLISAGAAAGLAAGFNAPIAGVMFVIEELLHDVSSLTLGTAILASFVGGVVSRILGGNNLNLDIQAGSYRTGAFAQEIPFFLLLGLLIGIVAGCFNRSIIANLQWTRRHITIPSYWRIGLAGALSGLILSLLPSAFWQTEVLQDLLTVGVSDWYMPVVALLSQFLLTLIACSVEAPGGLFVPSLTLGAALGSLIGVVEQTVLGYGQSATYAFAGMGAFFGAVAKVPITSVVMLFEITKDFNLVLPLMIACVTAYLVAEQIVPGSLYTHLLKLKGIELQDDHADTALWSQLTAGSVMQSRVETLDSAMSLEEAIQFFAASHHRGFPVLNEGRLVGIVTQTDLLRADELQKPGSSPLAEIMTPNPMTVNPQDTLAHVLDLLTRYKLSRLPVVDHHRLVGIITRSDILRAESEKLRGQIEDGKSSIVPSYTIYRTRAPAIGQGQLLLPVSNPQTAPLLIKIALAIAHTNRYEMECIHLISVPRHRNPMEVSVSTTRSRRLLNQATRQGQMWQVPTHTQIRVTHEVGSAILETVQENHPNLLVLGWRHQSLLPNVLFGDVVDRVMQAATCDVLLIKLGENMGVNSAQESEGKAEQSFQALMQLMNLNHWLIPISEDPNTQAALKLLPSLFHLSRHPKIHICQVFPPSGGIPDLTLLLETADLLESHLKQPVTIMPVCASSVAEAVIDMADKNQCDAVMLGTAPAQGLQQWLGNVPETIARHCRCTVMIFRPASTIETN